MSQTSKLRVPLGGLRPGNRPLPTDTARYVTRVHRLHVGQRFVVFDPETALETDAEIVSSTRSEVQVLLGEPRAARHRAMRQVMVVQAVGKADKTDTVIRDATELGATHFVLVASERSVARRSGRTALERHQRIAVEAARQCGRGDVPHVESTAELPDACERTIAPFLARPDARGFALHPPSEPATPPARPLRELLPELLPSCPVCIAVGPEGGFSPGDLEHLVHAGLTIATLGPLVLRTETVCAAVLGALLLSR